MHRSFLLAGSILFAATLAAHADSPREFLNHALQGDNSEIMLGNLAIGSARDPAVRDFGRTLVTDHTQARQQVLDVGRRFGIRPNHDVAPEARDERRKLMGMDRRDFDREFVRYMVQDHQKDIQDFRDEADEHHGQVSDLATRQLPTLRKHLDIAMSLDHGDRRDDRGDGRDGNRGDLDRGR